MHLLGVGGWGCALVSTKVPQVPQVPHVPHVVGVAIVVADVVVDSWAVLYERNKFSIENSYIVLSYGIGYDRNHMKYNT